MVCAETEDKYNALYIELNSLKLDSVSLYFNTQWHSCVREWAQFGRTGVCNFLNTTSNRLESLSQKIKGVLTKYSNIVKFFKDLNTMTTVTASEKNIKAVQSRMKVSRITECDETLIKFKKILTNFAYMQLVPEYDNQIETDSANNVITTDQNCTCFFFSSMGLPCRHIFKKRSECKMDVFDENLCLQRWKKEYLYASHPAY